MQHWTRIEKFNSKPIINILQPIIIDTFPTHSYIVYYFIILFLWSDSYFLKHLFLFRGFLIMKTKFSYCPGMFEIPAPAKYYLKKQNQNFYEILNICECVEKKSITIVCNIWMIFLELNWLFCDPSLMLQLSEFVWTPRSYESFITIFSW